MATNDQINSGSIPLTLSNGGTGQSSLITYTPLCGSDGIDDKMQTVASTGTSGQYLTGNLSSAAPSYEDEALLFATTTVTAAQLNNLGSSSVTIIAAPGANKTISCSSVSFNFVYNSKAFKKGADCFIAYTDSTKPITTSASLTASLIQGTSSFAKEANNSALSGQVMAAVTNEPIVFTNVGPTSFSTGDSTIDVNVNYVIVDTTY